MFHPCLKISWDFKLTAISGQQRLLLLSISKRVFPVILNAVKDLLNFNRFFAALRMTFFANLFLKTDSKKLKADSYFQL
jgi:hypothetical protein